MRYPGFSCVSSSAMDETTKGFRLGDGTLVPWGTRFDAVVTEFERTGYASRDLPCSGAYGFATRYLEVTAPRPDRPILTVAYELAATGTPIKDLFAQLVIKLGMPAKIDRDESSPHALSPGHVVLYANWQEKGRPIGVSFYGAPRESAFGDGIGKLYLSWGDLDAAAAPWMPAWRAANQEVEQAAGSIGKIRLFSVQYDARVFPQDDSKRPAELCLNSPEILNTPPSIARQLNDKRFALWSDQAGARWHLSTRSDTIVLGGPDTSEVRITQLEPARGGGSATIDIGRWWVRDAWKSRSIAEAERALESVPGLTFNRASGHDA